MTNTTKGVTPEAGQGEGVGTLSPVGTINTKRLGDLFLPREREYREALGYMDDACRRACKRDSEGRTFRHLNIARCAVLMRWETIVDTIRERGGLLLIGGRG